MALTFQSKEIIGAFRTALDGYRARVPAGDGKGIAFQIVETLLAQSEMTLMAIEVAEGDATVDSLLPLMRDFSVHLLALATAAGE